MTLRIGEVGNAAATPSMPTVGGHQRRGVDLPFRDQAQGVRKFIGRIAQPALSWSVCMESDRSEPMLGIMKELKRSICAGLYAR